jgi:probable HAF family extracellular repeat protein
VKSRILTYFTGMILFAALANPVPLTAQHTRYKLIDLGTFGGPNSSVPIVFDEINGTAGAQAITNQGIVTGMADTSLADPLCFFDDCFYPIAFQWREGEPKPTQLGALPSANWSSANWISENGLIVGISENGQNDPLTGTPEFRAVLWQDGEITDLGTLPGGYESFGASAVNSQGQAVGLATNGTPDPYSFFYFSLGILSFTGGTQSRAFLWDKHTGMQDLGTLGGPDAWAAFVNEQGQIAGISYTSFTANAANGPCTGPNAPTIDPFFWERDTGMIDIGSFGGTCGIANALNNRGQVAGQSYRAGNLVARAFLWDKNSRPRLRDLGTLGGDNSSALWIDDAGEVIGYADLPPSPAGCSGLTCVHHASLWKRGRVTDLGTIGADPCSRAFSINSKGQIVGASAAVCGGNLTHGFLWEQGGPAIDLDTLVAPSSDLSLIAPISINDRGEIAGYAMLANGDTHAFVLIPCDDDHPNVEGCDYSMVDPADVANNAVAPQFPLGIPPTMDSVTGTINPWQNWFRQRYRMLGQRSPLRD